MNVNRRKWSIVAVLLLIVSLMNSDFARGAYMGELTSTEEFSALAEQEESFYGNASYLICQAQTVCPNGMPIYCLVYGSQMISPAAGLQACQWWVLPGRAVRCAGFVQQAGPMGAFWAWVDVPVSCY